MSKKTSKPKEKPLIFHIGNFLIIVSLLLLFLILYPVIGIYIIPPQIKAQSELSGNYLTIPKIHAQAPIFFNIDPMRPSTYLPTLKKGVAQARGSALPGENGSVFVFAHSSGNPLEETHYNTIFLKLGSLKNGDEIFIKKDGKLYKYEVFDKKTVWPTETKYLKQTRDQLIIQTCWPIGTSIKRLLVFAKPIK